MKIIRSLLLLFISVSLLACQQRPEEHQFFEEQIITFGTVVDISLFGVERSHALELTKTMEEQFTYMNDAWHAWHPGVLAEVNAQLATGERFIVDEDILALLVEAKRLYESTGGYYDPGIGQLVALWQFDRFSERPPVRPPLNSAIQQILEQSPTMGDVVIAGREVYTDNPTVLIDMAGFAKGYAIDRIIEFLRAEGVNNAMINAGGDLRAIGRAGVRPWMIAIQNPNTTLPFGVIQIQGDESVFTSGDVARSFEYRGKRYHHILDASTGYPTDNHIRSVTILHDNGAEADAAATALMVAGLEHWEEVAESMNLQHILMIDDENNVYMTPQMAKRVTLLYSPAPNIVMLYCCD